MPIIQEPVLADPFGARQEDQTIQVACHLIADDTIFPCLYRGLSQDGHIRVKVKDIFICFGLEELIL